MKFLCSEKISAHKYKTPEGYLVCVDSVLSRTGKQTYRRREVFGADCCDSEEDVEVDRDYKEVFSPQALASFENKPIAIDHPDEDINVENYKDYAVGFVRDIKQGKTDKGEDVMLGTLVITDRDAIERIESGEYTDLSCGYDCDIIDEDNPQQRNIRGNHVALCQQGRAGIARIVDSKYGIDISSSYWSSKTEDNADAARIADIMLRTKDYLKHEERLGHLDDNEVWDNVKKSIYESGKKFFKNSVRFDVAKQLVEFGSGNPWDHKWDYKNLPESVKLINSFEKDGKYKYSIVYRSGKVTDSSYIYNTAKEAIEAAKSIFSKFGHDSSKILVSAKTSDSNATKVDSGKPVKQAVADIQNFRKSFFNKSEAINFAKQVSGKLSSERDKFGQDRWIVEWHDEQIDDSTKDAGTHQEELAKKEYNDLINDLGAVKGELNSLLAESARYGRAKSSEKRIQTLTIEKENIESKMKRLEQQFGYAFKDSVKDSGQSLNNLRSWLRHLSRRYNNDPGVDTVMKQLKLDGYQPIVESVEGWNAVKGTPHEFVKEYIISVMTDEGKYKILVQLYATDNDWKVFEINSYIVGKMHDSTNDGSVVFLGNNNSSRRSSQVKFEVQNANDGYEHIGYFNTREEAKKWIEQAYEFEKQEMGGKWSKFVIVKTNDSINDSRNYYKVTYEKNDMFLSVIIAAKSEQSAKDVAKKHGIDDVFEVVPISQSKANSIGVDFADSIDDSLKDSGWFAISENASESYRSKQALMKDLPSFGKEKVRVYSTVREKNIQNLGYEDYSFTYEDGRIYKESSINDKLVQSSSEEAFKKNIATEIRSGKDPKQAAAIAYSVKRENDMKDAMNTFMITYDDLYTKSKGYPKSDWRFNTEIKANTLKEALEKLAKHVALAGVGTANAYIQNVSGYIIYGKLSDLLKKDLTTYDSVKDEPGDFTYKGYKVLANYSLSSNTINEYKIYEPNGMYLWSVRSAEQAKKSIDRELRDSVKDSKTKTFEVHYKDKAGNNVVKIVKGKLR